MVEDELCKNIRQQDLKNLRLQETEGDFDRFENRSAEQTIRGRFVGGEGDVVDGDDPHEGLHVRIVGLGLKGVPEEDDFLDALVGDLGSDLKVPAQRAGEVLLHLEPGGVLNHLGGMPGSAEEVMGKLFFVLHGPSDHFGFLVVMGH